MSSAKQYKSIRDMMLDFLFIYFNFHAYLFHILDLSVYF